MMIKFGVMIISENAEGKPKHNYIETDTLVGVARIISTFKPARGYEVVKITVEESELLDLELAGYRKSGILEISKNQ